MDVTLVGENFTPGPTANAAIERLLGFTSEVRDGKAYRFNADLSEDPLAAPSWTASLDYCEDAVSLAELMEFEGRVPYIKPVRKEGKQRTQRYVCIFDHKGEVCVTTEFKKASYALAAAVTFVLEDKSLMT